MTEEEKRLQDHIKELEETISDYQKRDKKVKSLFNNFLLFLFKIFIGKGLKEAFYKLFSDLKEKKNITTETLSELAAAIVWRFSRIGLLSLVVVGTPIVFAILQYWLLSNQNKLIEQQNTRIEQQTYLQEASRRGALVFLMGNIFDEVNNELREDYNKDGIRNLSPQLIGRIIALSNSLKPYKFLDGDNLTDKEYSLERGQLLITLVNSEIDTSSLDAIYENADFSYSYLKGVDLEAKYLKGINFSNSILAEAILQKANLSLSDLESTNLINSKLSNANLEEAYMVKSNLKNSSLLYANLSKTNLYGANLDSSNAMYTNFRFASIERVSLIDANFIRTDLYSSFLYNTDFSCTALKYANLNRVWINKGTKLDLNILQGYEVKFIETSPLSEDSIFMLIKN